MPGAVPSAAFSGYNMTGLPENQGPMQGTPLEGYGDFVDPTFAPYGGPVSPDEFMSPVPGEPMPGHPPSTDPTQLGSNQQNSIFGTLGNIASGIGNAIVGPANAGEIAPGQAPATGVPGGINTSAMPGFDTAIDPTALTGPISGQPPSTDQQAALFGQLTETLPGSLFEAAAPQGPQAAPGNITTAGLPGFDQPYDPSVFSGPLLAPEGTQVPADQFYTGQTVALPYGVSGTGQSQYNQLDQQADFPGLPPGINQAGLPGFEPLANPSVLNQTHTGMQGVMDYPFGMTVNPDFFPSQTFDQQQPPPQPAPEPPTPQPDPFRPSPEPSPLTKPEEIGLGGLSPNLTGVDVSPDSTGLDGTLDGDKGGAPHGDGGGGNLGSDALPAPPPGSVTASATPLPTTPVLQTLQQPIYGYEGDPLSYYFSQQSQPLSAADALANA